MSEQSILTFLAMTEHEWPSPSLTDIILVCHRVNAQAQLVHIISYGLYHLNMLGPIGYAVCTSAYPAAPPGERDSVL